MYRALLASTMLPVVLKVLATSGTADKMEVEETGARKEQNDSTATIKLLRCGEKR